MKLDEAISIIKDLLKNGKLTLLQGQAVKCLRTLAERYLEIGEGILPEREREVHHSPDCRPYVLDGKEYECSCGNAIFVKGFNACRQEVKLRLLKNLPTVEEILKIIKSDVLNAESNIKSIYPT